MRPGERPIAAPHHPARARPPSRISPPSNTRLKLAGVIVLKEAVVLCRLRTPSIVQP
jgi:hypothetical protein